MDYLSGFYLGWDRVERFEGIWKDLSRRFSNDETRSFYLLVIEKEYKS